MRRALVYGCLLSVFLLAGGLSRVAAAADRGGHLTICHSVAPAPINPLITSSTIATNMSDLIFDPLAELDAAGELRSALAESWERSADGRTWSFRLRRGVRFHDGSTLSAEDVAATFRAVKGLPHGFLAFGLENVERIETPDPRTVRFHFKRFDAFFPDFIHLIRILPAAALQEGPMGEKRVGTGPYRLDAFSPKGIELDAFEGHFRGPPNLDRITVRILKNQRACYANFVVGGVDLVFVDDSADLQMITDIPHIRIISPGLELTFFLILNQRKSPFDNRLIRQALNYAYDEEYFEKQLHQSEKTVARVSPGFRIGKQEESSHFSYNPVEVKKLLTRSGFKDVNSDHILEFNDRPFRFEVAVVKGSALTNRILSLFRSSLERFGIVLDVNEYAPHQLMKKLVIDKDFEAALVPIATLGSVHLQYMFWHSERKDTNISSYKNKQVDMLFDSIRHSNDLVERDVFYAKLSDELMKDPPGIPLFVRETRLLVNDRYRGFVTDPYRFFSGLREVWVPKDLQRPEPKE